MHHADRNTKDGGSQENSITDFGVQEATVIGGMLKKVPVKTIYSGEYIRYKQTVELINKHIKAPVVVDNRLNEWSSKTESRKTLQKRTHAFLKEVIAKHNDEDIIICMTSGVNLYYFITFFNKCKPIKGFIHAQARGVCPIFFVYKKEED